MQDRNGSHGSRQDYLIEWLIAQELARRAEPHRTSRESRASKRRIIVAIGLVVLTVLVTAYVFPSLTTPITSTLQSSVHCATSTPHMANSVEKRVALVDGVSKEFPDHDFVTNVTASAGRAGYTLDYYPADATNLGLFTSLPLLNYSLIILRTHGGLYGPLTTSQPYSNQQYVASQLLDEVGAVNISGTVYFSMTPKGITNLLCGQFPGTVILAMGCGSDSNLASQGSAFVQRGARVLIAWDTWVGIYHSDLAYEIVTKMLLERNTIGAAVQGSLDRIGPDPLYGATLHYFPSTEAQFVL